MQIAMDALPLVAPRLTGIAYCQLGQLTALAATHPEDNYTLQFFEKSGQHEKCDRLSSYLRDNIIAKPANGSGYLYRLITSVLPFPSYSHYFGKDADITHFFNYIVPPHVVGKTVVTVHDMVCKAFPNTVRGRTKLMLSMGLEKSMKRADRIVTDSDFSRNEIIHYYPQFADKIRVVYCGVDTNRFHPIDDRALIDATRQKYALDRDYFFYLGTVEPRKNLARLIEAYSIFCEDKNNPPYLVLGGGKGWLDTEIYASAEKLGLKDLVRFTEYIPEEDICPLQCGALAFVFPSIYEGFGMPPLEAMACGTPVITTTAASLPEVVGDAARCVGPFQVDEIAAALDEIYTSPDLRAELREKGLTRTKTLSWQSAAETLHAVYEELI